jgi:hypothetical protein
MKRGVPQSASLGTADIFEPRPVPGLDHAEYPKANGEIAKDGTESARKRFKKEWVDARQKRQAALFAMPEHQFMRKVEGTTTPLLTQKDFNLEFEDHHKELHAARERQARAAERLVDHKVKLVTKLVGDMANHQKLRVELDNNNQLNVVSSQENPRADAVDAALHRIQTANKGPMTLTALISNINEAVELVITKSASISAISGGEDELMEWAMLPENSGILQYTSIYQQGLSLACAKLESVVGVAWSPEELIAFGNSSTSSQSEQNTNTLLANLVGLEILDNDTMVTRRYGKQFQAQDLKQKRAMLMRELKRRLAPDSQSGCSAAVWKVPKACLW